MKKIALVIVALIMTASLSAVVTIQTNWQLSAATTPSTLPTWIGTGNNCRGIAFGKMGTNERVFVVSRQDGNLIHVLNAGTGEKVGTLPMGTGIVTGSYFIINDAGMTEDGILLVGTMALANGEFKVYRWDSETSEPTLAISYPAAVGRLGDKITVSGSISSGTARVWAATATAVDAKTKIFYFDMEADIANPGKFKFVQTPKTFSSVTTSTSNPGVGLKTNGTVMYKSGGSQIADFDQNGTQNVKTTVSTVVATAGNTVRYVGADNNNDEYLVYFRYGLGQERVNLLKVPGGDLSLATRVDSTAALGTNGNTNGTGGVVVNRLSDGNVELYVLSTNNGVGKYTISGLNLVAGLTKSTNDRFNVFIKNNYLEIEGVNAVSIELFNALGQKIQSVKNSSILKFDNLRGVFFVRVKDDAGLVRSEKVKL